jgi:glycine cleavage system H protein
MSNVPEQLKYTKSHEWVRTEADGSVTVGITDHAQDLLGDMVYVELPESGRVLTAGKECAVVESVKAASDVFAPVSGEVIVSNGALESAPETVNKDPYGEGWLFKLKLKDAGELSGLLDAAGYSRVVAEDSHR